MSEKHTPGLLKAFNLYATPEIRDQDDGFIAHLKDGGPRSVANARRLVACWNACQRLDTDLLERISRPGSAGIHPAPQERIDELLAALETARKLLKMTSVYTAGEMSDIDAAIAKVKGGAT